MPPRRGRRQLPAAQPQPALVPPILAPPIQQQQPIPVAIQPPAVLPAVPAAPIAAASSADLLANKGYDQLKEWTADTSVKIEDWLSDMDDVRKAWNWNDTQVITGIKMKLSDPHVKNDLKNYITVKERITGPNTATWEDVKVYLISRYKSHLSQSAIKGQLYNCKQTLQPYESITDYHKRFKQILSKLNDISEKDNQMLLLMV